MGEEEEADRRTIERELSLLREIIAGHTAHLGSIVDLTEAKFVTYRALIDSQEQKVKLALDASEKAINKADIATEKAILKAEQATEKRFDSVNEFRAALSDQAQQFIRRSEVEQRFISVVEKIDAAAQTHRSDMTLVREAADRINVENDRRLKMLESAGANLQGRLWSLGAGIALIVVLVNVAIRFIG